MKVLLGLVIALLLAAAPAAGAVQWSTPQVLARDVARFTAPAVAVNEDGDALIAYRREGRYGLTLDVVRRARGGRLSLRQRLVPDSVEAADVALADDGRAFAAWVVEQEEDDTAFDVMLAEAAPGERFGEPRKLEELIGSWPDEVHLATAAGRLVLAYNDGFEVSIVARGRDGELTAPMKAGEGGEPDLAMNERGDARISWFGRARSRRSLLTVKVLDGRLGERRTLAPTGIAGYLRTGLGPRGGLLAAWQANWEEHVVIDRHYGAIRAQSLTAGGRTRPATAVDLAPDSERKGPQKPELAVARDGSGVVTWQRVLRPKGVRYALRGRVFAARLSPGGRRGRPQALSDPRAIATDARIATDRRGRSLAVWQQVPPESLSRPLRLVASSAASGRRFGRRRTVVRPAEKAELHTLAAHDRGFLLAYTRRTGRFTANLVLRSGR